MVIRPPDEEIGDICCYDLVVGGTIAIDDSSTKK
jgi:hypothetical protein